MSDESVTAETSKDPIIRKLEKFAKAPLPVCPARFDVKPDEGVYFCAHPRVFSKHNLVTVGVCRTCLQVTLPPPTAYLPFKLPPAYSHDEPCHYLGDVTSLRTCKSCRGNVRVKVHLCNHPAHQETTLSECLECPDYRPIHPAE